MCIKHPNLSPKKCCKDKIYLQKSVSNIQIYLQKSVIWDLILIFGMAESLILSMKEEIMPARFDLENYSPISGLIHW
jgi:hypothetical protein